MKVSVIYPVQSLDKDVHVLKAIRSYNLSQDYEQIIVTSELKDLDRKLGVKVFYEKTNLRAIRLNRGIQEAKGEVIVLHHPRSVLADQAFYELSHLSNDVQWGAFTHAFDRSSWGLEFTSWYSNNIRGDQRHIYYLDHCLFVRKTLLKKVGSIPNVAIFEDTILSRRLKSYASPKRLSSISITSSIRFQRNGFWKQSFINQILKIIFFFRGSTSWMNKVYEKNLELNSRYKKNKPGIVVPGSSRGRAG